MLETDLLIIGGGIAGLMAAISASEYSSHITIVTKGELEDTATEKAQGGIAAAIDEIGDSTKFHFEDTILAGCGLCNKEAVNLLVNQGVLRVKELIELGARFDKAESEGVFGFSLALEGAHRRRRILHAGDTTGAEIARTLLAKVQENKKITILKETLALDLIIEERICKGVVFYSSKDKKVFEIKSGATILATGGLGQVYLYTTNPEVATGDGVAMAYRGGADISDMEFIQFHPTSLIQNKEFEDIIALPQFLISEAVRGEGGILLNAKGERFMANYHERGELAPRDVVARAIFSEMKKNNSNFVLLDLSKIGEEKIKKRFPVIYKTCLDRNFNITRNPIPVAPAAHYSMGGIKTGLDTKTNIQCLFAAGECSSVGVHGANRLASNSLLEGLVFGHIAGIESSKCEKKRISTSYIKKYSDSTNLTKNELKRIVLTLKSNMWSNVGIIRNGKGLRFSMRKIDELLGLFESEIKQVKEIEAINMLTCAKLISKGALEREESRGAHYREDFPQRDDNMWQKSLIYNIISE